MKKEALVELVRDEEGHLLLQITGTSITRDMPSDFWKNLIEIIEEFLLLKEDFKQMDVIRIRQVLKIIEKGLRKQEEKESK